MPDDGPKVGKKLPKWAIPVGIVVVIGGVLYIRKRKAAQTSATEPGSEGLTNQSFIPVTGEVPSSMGSGGSGAAATPGENNAGILELIKGEREGREHKEDKQEAIWLKIFENLGTGGGAPHTGAPEGIVTAPPPEHAPWVPPPTPPTPAPPPAPPPVKPRCPGPKGFPFQGPHGCYHISRQKSHDGCTCHGYENGMLECGHRVRGTCTF